MNNELVWWSVWKDGQQWICTLPDTRGLQTTGAHAAHGPFVPFPFEIEGPVSPAEVEWAESEMDKRIADQEAEDRNREAYEKSMRGEL